MTKSDSKFFVDEKTGEFAIVTTLVPRRCPNGHTLYVLKLYQPKKGSTCCNENCEYYTKVVYT